MPWNSIYAVNTFIKHILQFWCLFCGSLTPVKLALAAKPNTILYIISMSISLPTWRYAKSTNFDLNAGQSKILGTIAIYSFLNF